MPEHSERFNVLPTIDLSDWVPRCLKNALDEFTAKLQSGLAILASVGSTAPFVGLFGTVWAFIMCCHPSAPAVRRRPTRSPARLVRR